MSRSFLDGVIPIAVMPFDENDQVDLKALKSEIDFLVSIGIKWVGFGFGSEVYTLAESELIKALTYSVEVAKGEIGIIGNVELNSTKGAIERVNNIKATGASMVMMRPGGMMAAATSSDVAAAFREVGLACTFPIVIQDAPQNTGVNLSPQVLADLLENAANIASLKIEPLSPATKISEVIKNLKDKNLSVIGGLGAMELIHEIKRGSKGTMPGPAFPEVFREIQNRMNDGDEASARKLFNRILPLLVLSNRDMSTFLFMQKYLLQRRGVLSRSNLRTPHSALDPHLIQEIEEMLVEIDYELILKECS
jgi:4-hydroxy-tetrahydrodipicolinate synthase